MNSRSSRLQNSQRTSTLPRIQEEEEEEEEPMGPHLQESDLEFLHSLLGLCPDSQPESPIFSPPIFIALPSTKNAKKVTTPFQISILDLLDISSVSPEKIITTHTFSTSILPSVSTIASSPRKKRPIFVTANQFTLPQLLQEKRELVFVTIDHDKRTVNSMLLSLGLTPETKILGILDIEMLAREVIEKCGSCPFLKIVHRPDGSDTDGLLKGMLVLAVGSAEKEVVDEENIAWVECLRAVGTTEKDEIRDEMMEMRRT